VPELGGRYLRVVTFAPRPSRSPAIPRHSRAASPEAKRDSWQVTNAVCRYEVNPTIWTRHVSDRAIVIGWAGYDVKVRFLPPGGGAIYGKHPWVQ